MKFVAQYMENRIYKLALGFITAALLLSVLWPYEQKLIDWDSPANYEVLESDELYFNNTRIVQYRTEESDALNQQGFKVHRSTKAFNDTTYPVLNFAIVNHWRNDLAYIVCEPNLRGLFGDTSAIAIGDTTVKLVLDHMDYNDHYTVCRTPISKDARISAALSHPRSGFTAALWYAAKSQEQYCSPEGLFQTNWPIPITANGVGLL